MALVAKSICLFHDENIGNSCLRSGLTSHPLFYRRRVISLPGVAVVKIWSSSRKSKYFRSSRSCRNFGSFGSKRSTLPSRRTEKLSSSCGLGTNKHEIFDFLLGKVLIFLKEWRQSQLLKIAGFLVCALMVIPSADAVDALKTCACLLKECRVELAKCIGNPLCAANVACLQTCNNRPDETECQIKCGDLFENSVVDEFNDCAVSQKKCVPKKSDVGEFPVPDPAVLVRNFNITDFNGKWFISSGLNPTFDTFDCQLHEFHMESNKLVGNLSWRIRTPDGGFFTRSTTQRFVQDPDQPGILYNHDNEYLHYQDD